MTAEASHNPRSGYPRYGRPRVRLGVDRLLEDEYQLLAGKRLGLLTNESGQTSELVPTIDAVLAHPQLQLTALFGPEHGVRGHADSLLPSGQDPITGLPFHSLYDSRTRRPSPEMLEEVDALLFDVQDVGVRFYTYISTLAHVMEAAAHCDVEVVVLDRPNPITGTEVEGNVLDPRFSSFVGLYPIALRHGMTIGEMALLFNDHFRIGCRLKVVAMEGWRRSWWFEETGAFWVIPSPNMPTPDTAVVYPGLCLLEETNVSEGRGTTKPFQLFGAPWINAAALWKKLRSFNLPGVAFRQAAFIPMYRKYQNELCYGLELYVTDRQAFRPVATGLYIIAALLELFPEQMEIKDNFHRLMGTDTTAKRLLSGEPVEAVLADFEPELKQFVEIRNKYLLYPD